MLKIVRDTMAAAHLKAVLVRVTVGGEEVLTRALGESMTGVPASTTMHFRNGAVAISYVATLLLRLVDQNKVSLDDKLAKWLPDVPNADRVTLGQLAQMTSGYPDYVLGNAEWEAGHVRDVLQYYSASPERLSGKQIPVAGGLDVTFHEPLGVVAGLHALHPRRGDPARLVLAVRPRGVGREHARHGGVLVPFWRLASYHSAHVVWCDVAGHQLEPNYGGALKAIF